MNAMEWFGCEIYIIKCIKEHFPDVCNVLMWFMHWRFCIALTSLAFELMLNGVQKVAKAIFRECYYVTWVIFFPICLPGDSCFYFSMSTYEECRAHSTCGHLVWSGAIVFSSVQYFPIFLRDHFGLFHSSATSLYVSWFF